ASSDFASPFACEAAHIHIDTKGRFSGVLSKLMPFRSSSKQLLDSFPIVPIASAAVTRSLGLLNSFTSNGIFALIAAGSRCIRQTRNQIFCAASVSRGILLVSDF